MIYTEENNRYQIDLSKSIWSMNSDFFKIYPKIRSFVNDVDWVLETERELILIEFKDYRTKEPVEDWNIKYPSYPITKI